MQARSALFDLYGDYLRSRGGLAPVAALVKLLAPVGIAAPAVRTAVSRMVREGWLHPLRLAAGPGYLLTPKAAGRLNESSARPHRTGRIPWDGRFDLVLLRRPAATGVARRMGALGYGMLDERTWVAPRAADEVDSLLTGAAMEYERFSAAHTAGSPSVVDVVGRAWNLSEIGRGYDEFVATHRPLVSAVTGRSTDEEAYAARFALVRSWRTVGSRDPHLPAALLPTPWPGAGAASFFDRHAARLRPAAERFVERCLASASRGIRVGFSEP